MADGILSKIFTSTLGTTIEKVGSTIDKFVTTSEEKARLQIEMEKVLQQHDSELEQTVRAELQAKTDILVAELQQGDNYTKRARPSIIYVGLAMSVINYCIIPIAQMLLKKTVAPIPIPAEFWAVWGAVASTWVIGRTAERRGSHSKMIDLVTGSDEKSRVIW